MFPKTRMRRYRTTPAVRRLAQEQTIRSNDLILPLFVLPGLERNEPVTSMPGVSCLSCDQLEKTAANLRVGAVLLFGVPDASDKDALGAGALREDGLIPKAVRALKKVRPDLAVITDVCLCSWTSHGHCGVLTPENTVDNDRTIEALGKAAVAHAAAGADLVAPSAMMDGQVAAIRDALDANGLHDTGILSYAAKFASTLYGPFRDAAKSSPSFGDRTSYQLSPANRREAIRDALLDEDEGADWLMVKPASFYLDVLTELRTRTRLPLAAYQVSGEYAMIKLAAQAGLLSERDVALESVLSIKRAGADAVITYYAEDICQWLDR